LQPPVKTALIFCNHRDAAERISESLNQKGVYATYYHGGMDQDERERALIQFLKRQRELSRDHRFGRAWARHSRNEKCHPLPFAVKSR
jgi:hypothetical protein